MTTSRPLPPHLQRQMQRFIRALESLPPGAALHVTREARGLRWQSAQPQPSTVPLPDSKINKSTPTT